MVAYTVNFNMGGRRQIQQISEFKASLVYVTSSRAVRSMRREERREEQRKKEGKEEEYKYKEIKRQR